MSTDVNKSQNIAELDPLTFEQLDQASQIENNDIFVIDQPDATRKVLYTDVKTKILSEDGSDLTVNYDVADTVENIAPGETIGTMFKKISSWFISKISQLGTLAFKDKISESDLDSAYVSTITGHLNDTVLHSTSTEKELWNDKYTKVEIDEKLKSIDLSGLPKATEELNGLMSKDSVRKLTSLEQEAHKITKEISDAKRTPRNTVYCTLKQRLDEDKNSIWLRKEATHKAILNEDENQNGQLEIAGLKDAILDNSTMFITPVLKSGDGDTVPGNEILRMQTVDYSSPSIGAKNLLKNTKTLGSGFSKPAKATINTKYLGLTVYKNEFSGASRAEDLRCDNAITPSPGSYYTLSFYAKGEGGIESYFHPETCTNTINSQGWKSTSADGYSFLSLSTEWKKYWVTWKTKSEVSGAKNVIVCRQTGEDNSTVHICGAKLEEGETATPWTANPEDIDAKCILMSLSRSALDSLSYDILNDQGESSFPSITFPVDLNVKVSHFVASETKVNQCVGNPTDLTTSSKEVVGAVNELNSALSNRFECGTVTVAGQGSGKWSFVAVSYRYSHKNIPMVVASHGRTNIAPVSCSIRNKTDTGFEIGLYNTAESTDFNWLAIEP